LLNAPDPKSPSGLRGRAMLHPAFAAALGHASLQSTEAYLRADPTESWKPSPLWHRPACGEGSQADVSTQG
jgi:hypothetical protein